MTPSTSEKLEALRRGDLAGTRELRLPGLRAFPPEIFALADSLEILDLSGGALTELPLDMARLPKLRALFCSGNPFQRLPDALGDCASLAQIGLRNCGLRDIPGEALPPKLRWLTLTDNRIETLPAELGRRPHLQKLMLAGNRLRTLPDELAAADGLELLRLSSNRLDVLPGWLAELPSLAWISWSGNPLERALTPTATCEIPWPHIDLGDGLGEGASGRVFRAHWRPHNADRQAIAVKIFKGAMTSDGRPEREMAACLTAGAHPGLVGAIGRIVGHPEGMEALAMPLSPPHWRVLAGPPSLDSCSRDVYAPELRFGLAPVAQIAKSVAAAVAHLHDRGILHGDLYAHNILWDGADGKAVLSDFGAACALPEGSPAMAWRRIETRAWGLLLGELLDRLAPDADASTPLRELGRACIQPATRARPPMSEVVEALTGC